MVVSCQHQEVEEKHRGDSEVPPFPKPRFNEMRAAQAKQLCRSISESGLTWSGLTEVSELLCSSAVWTPEQVASFQDAVSTLAIEEPTQPGLRRSRPPQTCKHFAPFLTTEDVLKLKSSDIPASSKVDVLVIRCVPRLHFLPNVCTACVCIIYALMRTI